MKVCCHCKVEKDEKEFGKLKTTKDGLRKDCKQCRRQYYVNNKDTILVNRKRYYDENVDEVKKRNNKHYHNNKSAIVVKRKKYREDNKKYLAEKSAVYREENKEEIVKRKRGAYYRNKDKNLRISSNWRNSPCRTLRWKGILPNDDEPLMIDGSLTVACKLCKQRMTPNNSQLSHRTKSILGKDSGENHFYCSDQCKNSCQIYRARTDMIDPRSKLYTPKSNREEDRNCQTDHLKQLQCDETDGQSYCERCGDFGEVQLHHTQRVGSKDAVSSAGHILLCLRCHDYELHQGC